VNTNIFFTLNNRIPEKQDIPEKEKIMEKGEKQAADIRFICKSDLKAYFSIW